MSFTIGTVTLPIYSEAKFRFLKDLKDIKLLVQLPFLLNFGPKVPVLKLKGYLAEAGKDSDQLETDYIIPLRDMVWQAAAFPRLIADEDQAAVWSKIQEGSGSYDITLVDSTTVFVKGKNSLALGVVAGSYTTVGIQIDYGSGTEKDFLKQDFSSLWFYGLNNSEVWEIRFVSTTGNYYSKQFTDNFALWKRIIRRKDEFSKTGGPDWSSIRYVELRCTPTGTHTNYLDRWLIGVGQLVDGPGTRYDGLYIIRDFTFDETYKATNAFPYSLELWLEDDYY